MPSNSRAVPRQILNIFDLLGIMLGIIIGVGIYETAGTIAAQSGDSFTLLSLWIAGGVISLCGALVYAELASAFPHEGGEGYYLKRSFGPWLGFLFAWGGMLIIRPGSIAAMAFPFAHYALSGFSAVSGQKFSAQTEIYLAILSVVLFTALNLWRFNAGKATQNVLTLAKVLGLVFLFLACIAGPAASESSPVGEISSSGLNLAMILIIFSYGGWNELGYVAAEIRDYKKTISRSIILTILITAALYILVTAGLVRVLGLNALATSTAPASDALEKILPGYGLILMSIMVSISALGALNGLIITSARIVYTLNEYVPAFEKLGIWDSKSGSPQNALITQMAISVLIICLTGSFVGTVVYTTAVTWMFFTLTAVGFFILRVREQAAERPFLTPLYPLIPLVFLTTSAYLSYSAFAYDLKGSIVAFLIITSGVPVYLIGRRRIKKE